MPCSEPQTVSIYGSWGLPANKWHQEHVWSKFKIHIFDTYNSPNERITSLKGRGSSGRSWCRGWYTSCGRSSAWNRGWGSSCRLGCTRRSSWKALGVVWIGVRACRAWDTGGCSGPTLPSTLDMFARYQRQAIGGSKAKCDWLDRTEETERRYSRRRKIGPI